MAIDPRFYRPLKVMNFGSVATDVNANPRSGLDRVITGISSFEEAGPEDLCFVEDIDLLSRKTEPWEQGACLVPPNLAGEVAHLPQFLSVPSPKQSFFEIARQGFSPRLSATDYEAPAIHESATLGDNCRIGAGAVIGERTQIGAGTVIGPGVQIGADCSIGSNASISFSLVGNQVKLLAGVRLGEAGFGLMNDGKSHQDIPHFGRVIVQDSVTIGANSCVDRGMLADTFIGEGSKIDNLCHIGHNTHIGRHVVLAAYAGISGSVVIGDYVQMGGRVGLVDHISIGKGAQIAAGSAVLKDVPAYAVWAGAPARPIKAWQREISWLKRQARRGQSK